MVLPVSVGNAMQKTTSGGNPTNIFQLFCLLRNKVHRNDLLSEKNSVDTQQWMKKTANVYANVVCIRG